MAAFLLPTPPSSSSPPPIPRRHTPPLSSPRALSSTSIPPTPPPAASPSSQPKAVIIGAGLAGLAAAVHLHTAKIPFDLLDSSDAVGGRVRTDLFDGFHLDRGFQILLTAYPESSRLLHYPFLQLRPFYPGSLVFHSSGFHLLSDPFRHPLNALLSLLPYHPFGSILDKLLVLYSRLLLSALPPRALLSSPKESSTLHRLRSFGFSDSIIDRFFRPFFAGVFFDPDLATSSRLFDFVFHCLSLGDCTPKNSLSLAGKRIGGERQRNLFRYEDCYQRKKKQKNRR